MEFVNRMLLIVTLAAAAVAAGSGFSVAGLPPSSPIDAQGSFDFQPEYTMSEHLQ